MTDREYLKQMFELTVRLSEAVNVDGFRSDAYNDILKEVTIMASNFNRSRRRRNWLIILLLFVLFSLLCLVVFTILI